MLTFKTILALKCLLLNQGNLSKHGVEQFGSSAFEVELLKRSPYSFKLKNSRVEEQNLHQVNQNVKQLFCICFSEVAIESIQAIPR